MKVVTRSAHVSFAVGSGQGAVGEVRGIALQRGAGVPPAFRRASRPAVDASHTPGQDARPKAGETPAPRQPAHCPLRGAKRRTAYRTVLLRILGLGRSGASSAGFLSKKPCGTILKPMVSVGMTG